MKKILLTLLFSLFCLSSMADSKRIEAFVSGMVCADCYAKVEGKITQYPQVKSATINPDDGLCTILLKEGKDLSHKAVTKAVERAGFKVTSFKTK
jgi:copper chaperone CopZ